MIVESAVAIIGAGPIGVELAIALKTAQIPYLHFDKGQVAQMIYEFPVQTHFYSSNDRIGIAGFPIHTVDQQKCSRENYLAYLRTLVLHYKLKVHTYEEVYQIEKEKDFFLLYTRSAKGLKKYRVRFLVLATGGTSAPRRLNVPGEDLPHVSSKMEDPHKYFQQKVLVIGAKNSAAETALRCFHVGADVSMSLRTAEFESVKYWIMPELQGRIDAGEIKCHYQSHVHEIFPDRVALKNSDQSKLWEVEADFVIKAIGFYAKMDLFEQLGAAMTPEQQIVVHDEEMQTTVPDLFVLGTAVAGTQIRYRSFIENCHPQVQKILKALSRRLDVSVASEENLFQVDDHRLEE